MANKSRQLINEVIIDLCGSRGGLNLQLLETHFRHLFSSSFKKTTGLKLIEYLRKNTSIFALYQPNGKQWKVMLVGHHRPNLVKRKKHKIKKSQKTISREKIKVEEFDIRSVYPKTSVISEDMKCQTPSTCGVLLKAESCKHSSKVIQNAEATRVNDDGDDDDDYDDDDDDDDDQIVKKDDEQETINLHEQKIIEPLKASSSSSRIENITCSNLTKQAIYKSSAFKNDHGNIAEMVKNNSYSSTVESVSKDKNTQLLQNATNKHKPVCETEMKEPESNMSHQPSPDSVAHSMREFMEKVHSFNKNFGSFALVVGKADIVPNIESLARIPWLCVFDFDMFSREDGLMSVLDGHMNTVHPCTLTDRPRFSFSYTYWCQLRGDSQVPDTCMECDARSWLNRIKPNLDNHLGTLLQYITNITSLKVVVLWPEKSEDVRFIYQFLTMLDAFLLPDIFVVYSDRQKDPEGFGLVDFAFKLQAPLESFYSFLNENIQKVKPEKTATGYRLPTFDKSNDPGIDDYTANHLREVFNVLYIQDDGSSSHDVSEIKEEGKNFLRGGTLPWFVYYENCEGGYFDIRRDKTNSILRDIKDRNISRSLSAILEVYHPPGAGGTTISQRILWDLHEDVPCVQVKSNIHSTISDLVQHIKCLFDKTQLPILVLLDGRDELDVKQFYNQLRIQSVSVIILHVQRIRKDLGNKILPKGKYWVKSHVSKREANQFCLRYEEFCDTEENKENLQTITNDVSKGGHRHVYEFGLTTFAHEYKGVESLVRECLELQAGGELDSTQRVLGYLSLVYFFGQTCVPCDLLSKILKRDKRITYDDLPFVVRQLVVKSYHHHHEDFIRICHQIVAKEILEQILTRNVLIHQKPSDQNLSQDACRNLSDFGIEFINDMKKLYNKKVHWRENQIVEILTKTFLQRNIQDFDEYNTCSHKQKPKFSRFFTDLEENLSRQDRIEIMKNIVSCCPENPNYHAHLGRMYTLYFPGEFNDVTENIFKKAISLCEKEYNIDNEISHSFEEQCSNSSIYHMYGMHFHQRVRKITRDSGKAEFEKDIDIVLNYAQNACLNFETAWGKSLPGIGQSYGLIGEIKTRLEVCDYIHRKLGMRLLDCDQSPMSPMVTFVKESMVKICDLITQCYSTVDRDELPATVFDSVSVYAKLFCVQEMTQLFSTDVPDDCTKRRHFVTQQKVKYGKFDILSLNNEITSDEIDQIVKNLEENFNDLAKMRNGNSMMGSIESDFKDWINAVRLKQYKKEIRLEDVLVRLHQWQELVNTPISKFYVFILCASLTILNKDKNRFFQAKETLDEVKKYKNHVVKPYKPREWLGITTSRSFGVKCLIPGSFLKPIPDSSVDEVDIVNDNDIKPKFLKGTILGPNKHSQYGSISLSVCNGAQFDVFFNPVRTKEKLVGPTYSNKRVEFILGFTVSHGFMAYNVRILKALTCEKCNRNIEFVTFQYIAECLCGNTVQKLKADDKFFPAFSHSF